MLMSRRSDNQLSSGRLILVLAVLLFSQNTLASFIRIRPNTYKEFQYINCQGRFDKEQYASLTNICEDCHNVYRNPDVLLGCKADCFRNSLFPKCVSMLLLDQREPELSKMVYTVSGKRPLMYDSNAVASLQNPEI
uniref:ITP-like preproprotein n=1 Tax=Chorismus antarcticus TaxID=442697 RepID=A0A1W5LU42_CHOAN|nr:ITP-like preproprotein [Chorismus antarcticus]